MYKQLFLAFVFLFTVPVTELADDETLLLYPATAVRGPAGTWNATLKGRIFENEESSWLRNLFIKALSSELDLSPADRRSVILKRRVRDFLADNERGKEIRINIGGSSFSLGKSGADGHFQKTLILPQSFCPRSLSRPVMKKYHAVLKKEEKRKFSGNLLCIPGRGISVISDIDDTIKVSNVLDKRKMLVGTFLKPFRAVPGMALRYRTWQRRGASFHYVSGSPWQLYGAISRFIKRANFPPGDFALKDFRIRDRSFFSFLSGNQKKYKVRVISGIMERHSRRSFILVGDSGESDPEVYAEVAARFPGRVRAVYIRDAGNLKERRKGIMKIFSALRGVKFSFFERGSQLPANI